jgi:hypothetical protein
MFQLHNILFMHIFGVMTMKANWLNQITHFMMLVMSYLDITLAELLLLRITNHWELLQRKIFRDSYSEKCRIDAYMNSA